MKSKDTLSVITLTPSSSKTTSSSPTVESKSNLYWNPLHPPPSTVTLRPSSSAKMFSVIYWWIKLNDQTISIWTGYAVYNTIETHFQSTERLRAMLNTAKSFVTVGYHWTHSLTACLFDVAVRSLFWLLLGHWTFSHWCAALLTVLLQTFHVFV